ncbi:uncharacterized protein MKZ38_008591 [Zalerion maritima]|uniref:Cytochrome P450 n=1 Tax=Zalerion maritima TaxID=339359 RepID=A0AAD5WVD9_9PEZI|nr:uncharacterized protein MKZ38_008591 [Zalerion maritima]
MSSALPSLGKPTRQLFESFGEGPISKAMESLDGMTGGRNISVLVYPAVFLLALIVFTSFRSAFSKSAVLPAGPPSIPVFGNLLQVPLEKPFLYFASLVKEHGDILGFRLGPRGNPRNHVVVLSSPKHVKELFDKKGAHYGDRPQYKICCDYVLRPTGGGGPFKHVLFMPHGKSLRQYNRATKMLTSQKGVQRCWPAMEREAARFVGKIQSLPPHLEGEGKIAVWRKHLRFWALATPMRVIAGQDIDALDDDDIARYYHAQHEWLSLLTPGKTPPVDIFPFLTWIPEWFPGGAWKTKAKEVKVNMENMYYGLQKASALPGGQASLLASIRRRFGKTSVPYPKDHGGFDTMEGPDLKIAPEDRYEEDQLAWIGGSLLDAAVDTTLATMGVMIMVFANNPDIQKKVQREVDEVCGNRKPRGEDLAKMKYLKACAMEILRWRPPAPNGLPHVLSKPSTYEGYAFLPGTTFLIDVWGIHMDPNFYEDPQGFHPERFLDNPMGIKPHLVPEAEKTGRKSTYTFGSGRRMCPGEAFAVTSTIMNAATLAWAVDVKAPGGKRIDDSINTGFITGLVLGPEEFAVDFSSRKGRSV